MYQMVQKMYHMYQFFFTIIFFYFWKGIDFKDFFDDQWNFNLIYASYKNNLTLKYFISPPSN